MRRFSRSNCIHALDDAQFDSIYPAGLCEFSCIHWTPVNVARRASEFLVQKPGTRVLDIGSGLGKFCIIGALMTAGRFTGVEQRKHLCEVAQMRILQADISNAAIIHGNIVDVKFSDFDAFYLFNPFEENLDTVFKSIFP